MAPDGNNVDDAAGAAPVKAPSTPHELHAYGAMTPAAAARFIGSGRTQIHEQIATGYLPTTAVFGTQKIEPLVVWAARLGAPKETLHAIPRALRKGASVDDVVALVDRAIEEQEKQPRQKRVRGKKPAPTEAT